MFFVQQPGALYMQSEHDLLCLNNPAPNIGKIMPHSNQIISGQRAMQLENSFSLRSRFPSGDTNKPALGLFYAEELQLTQNVAALNISVQMLLCTAANVSSAESQGANTSAVCGGAHLL